MVCVHERKREGENATTCKLSHACGGQRDRWGICFLLLSRVLGIELW